ncbi:MAG: ABC transporter substrate-binding protein [bacterium]
MKRNICNIRFLQFVAILVVLGIGFAAWQACSSKTNIRIAVNIPLTGPIASFSGQYHNGLSLGIDDACKEYGVSRDKFILDVQDNTGKPSQAVSAMQKQMLQKPNIFISGTSDMSTAVAPEIQKANIPHFLVAFDAYLSRGDKNRLRILPHYKIEAPIYVKYAKMRNAKKVYIIALNLSSIDEEFSAIVEPGLSEAGIEYKREMYEFGTKEYKTIVLKVSKYKPDLIFVSGFAFHIYPILGALRTYGMIQDGSVLCTLDLVDLLHNDTPRSELEGVAFIAPLYEIPGAIEGLKEWRQRFKTKFGKQPSYVEAYAYDTGRVIVAAYKKSGVVDADTIRSVLPFEGIVGEINLDQDGDLMATLAIAEISGEGTVTRVDR